MSLIYKKGDILEATENIICHQVNVDGVMGGGLAKQIAIRYPNVEQRYKNFCKAFNNDYDLLQGITYIDWQDDEETKAICNCFTQKPNFDTDYIVLKCSFGELLESIKKDNKTICVPYGYGCGIANGDWDIVSEILEQLSHKYGVDISVYKLEETNEN